MQNDNINEQILLETLRNQFGLSEFRAGQLEAITTLLTQQRLLCIQPTGHGKSLLYQLPAVLLSGITLVISPLLALMRDQLAHLHTRFNINAVSLNSDQTEQQNYEALGAAQKGACRILFVAPEQFDNIERFNMLLQLPINLLVVDEAHCISSWGHDFRPSYRQIIQFVRALEQKNAAIKILGLTATADQKTEIDIKQQLSSASHSVIVQRSHMNRPNIQLHVLAVTSIAEKLNVIFELLTQFNSSGLIYCATRENTELVAEYLKLKDINAVAYHAGFPAEEKLNLQKNFLLNKYRVVVATNALGMGIDKSDLRFIIHFDMPGSITAYYQEVGRCGRDGLPAHGILLFDTADKKIQQYFIETAEPSAENFQQILTLVAQATEPPNLLLIKRLSGLHPTLVAVIIAELVEQNYLIKSMQRGLQVYQRTAKTTAPDLSRYCNQRQVKMRELKIMLAYGEEKHACLMATLRIHLGDKQAEKCGHCSVCSRQPLSFKNDSKQTREISAWLKDRTVTIEPAKTYNVSSGIALLDAKLRSPLFIQFMQQRSKSTPQQLGIHDELLTLMQQRLKALAKQTALSCIIALPSRTWGARDALVNLLGQQLNIPVFLDFLAWCNVPTARQGELLNNDQRRYNVDKRMGIKVEKNLPKGTVLLFDDYVGSGATLKEATRVLRKTAGVQNELVPFTIAAVKWRLGKPGMV